MTCDRCGQDVGTEGVVTVLVERNKAGRLESLPVRECRECALREAQKGDQ